MGPTTAQAARCGTIVLGAVSVQAGFDRGPGGLLVHASCATRTRARGVATTGWRSTVHRMRTRPCEGRTPANTHAPRTRGFQDVYARDASGRARDRTTGAPSTRPMRAREG